LDRSLAASTNEVGLHEAEKQFVDQNMVKKKRDEKNYYYFFLVRLSIKLQRIKG